MQNILKGEKWVKYMVEEEDDFVWGTHNMIHKLDTTELCT